MSLLSRTTRQLRPFGYPSTRSLAFTQSRLAHQDYGSGEQYPGKNPSEDKEHPGPPPPSVADKGGDQSQQQQQPKQGESKKPQDDKSKGTQTTQTSKGVQGAQPKILDRSPPKEGEEPEDVKRHNRELENRAEKTHEKVNSEDVEKDKVGKSFWAGQGGRDKQP